MTDSSPPLDTIDSKAVRTLAEAHALQGVTILGRPGGWAVLVRYGEGQRAVAGQKSRRMRLWRHADGAIGFVRDELGVDRFDVDAADHVPDMSTRRRPDTTDRLRRQREAVGHDAWFRAQVGQALDGIVAGTNPIVADDDVEARLNALRAGLAHRVS